MRSLLVALIAGAATLNAQRPWSLVAPQRPPLPSVRDVAWPRNAVDRFVLDALEAKGQHPSPPADDATWLRRVSLDLVGLPPTLAEIDAFLVDDRADARQRVVERLLASPHYGERWARPWLDLARYADTNGYEKDRPRSLWPWRDWVIATLNADLPFDQFTIEQLAGDLLPHPTRDQLIATGFHRNTMHNEEGGIDVEEFRYAAVVDRVNTTATTWLGLTVGCAQCHDHKYDPITQRDYFGLLALFDNCDEVVMQVPDAAIEQARAQGEAKLAALRRDRRARFPLPMPATWQPFVPTTARAEHGTELAIAGDGAVLASGAAPGRDVYEIEGVVAAGLLAGVRVEALRSEQDPARGPGRTAHGNFVLSEIEVSIQQPAHEWQRVTLTGAEADASQTGFPVTAAIDGDKNTGWGIHGGDTDWRRDRAARFSFDAPLSVDASTRVRVVLRQNYGSQHTLLRLRLAFAYAAPGVDTAAVREAHLRQHFDAWRANERTRARPWQVVVPTAMQSAGLADFAVQPDGSILVYGNNPDRDTTTLVLAPRTAISAIRVEALPDASLPAGGPGRSVFYPEGGFTINDARACVLAEGGGASRALRFARAVASYEHPEHKAAHAIDAAFDTDWTNTDHVGRAQHLVLVFEAPMTLAAGERLEVTLAQQAIHNNNLGRFRIAVTDAATIDQACGLPSELEAALLQDESLSSADEDALLQAFLSASPELAAANAEIRQHERDLPVRPTTLALRERDAHRARRTPLRQRGEFLRPREVVAPGVPACLPPLQSGAPSNRLTLARWLVSGDHPLTARVVVNRAVDALFGRGIVATVDDFGTRGEAPSHRALLDWLACEFVAQGWSMKRLHRLLVSSATYGQASAASEDAFRDDPDNRGLARMSRLRLPAEIVRDQALFASGLLVPRLFGASVFPPQPAGVSDVAYGQAEWKVSKGQDRYRRGLYTFQKRTAPYAMHALFDAPSGEACVARRARTGTPLQALTLLNDAVFVEAAQALARVVCAESSDDASRLRAAFGRCLSRTPSVDEGRVLLAFVARQRERLSNGELDASALVGAPAGAELSVGNADLAAWTSLARVLFNLDEMLVRG